MAPDPSATDAGADPRPGDTLQRNQQAFTAQSAGFSSAGDTYADAEDLVWMLAELPLSVADRALDLATGTGELARALAPRVATVVGIDATEAMLEQGRRFVAQHGIANIHCEQGIVEALPFESESFDVTSARARNIHESVLEWMEFSLTSDANRSQILGALRDELAGGPRTGLSPFERDGALYFRQRDAAVVGRKKG